MIDIKYRDNRKRVTPHPIIKIQLKQTYVVLMRPTIINLET